MPKQELLGIYWGTDSFSIVESINGQIANLLHLPFSTPTEQEGEEKIPDDLRFPTIIKKAIEFRSIKTSAANLSIPTTDIIFRSFSIPFMDKKDVFSVVEFEVTKYIPLKLDELVYTYHTVAYTEGSQKKLRVLFVAIRKTRLQEMISAVEQAGLTLKNIEPAPVSLIQLLKRNRILSKNQTVAILNLSSESSEIFVIEDETLQFMRKLNVTANTMDASSLQSGLVNEVRVSFNFYNRQNPQGKIDQLIILSEYEIPKAADVLQKELNIAVSSTPLDKMIPIKDYQTVNHLTAFGATLRTGLFSTKYFDLSQEAIDIQRSGKDPLEGIKRYAIVGGVLIGCVIVSLLAMVLGKNMLKYTQGKIDEKKALLGKFENLTAVEIQNKTTEKLNELAKYTSVRTTSKFAMLLMEIPAMLPEGTWLTNWKMSYVSPEGGRGKKQKSKTDTAKENVEINLSGNIYSPDANEQFRILNVLVENLKTNPAANQLYESVKRDTAVRKMEAGFIVTGFQITCR